MSNDTHKSIVSLYQSVPSISVLSRDCFAAYDRIVCMIITKMCNLLSVKEIMTPEQQDAIPELLLNEFGYMRINDISMCCRLVVTGKFKIFERMDVETFFRCLREYDALEERITAREQFHKQGHAHNESALEVISQLPEELKKEFKKIGKGQKIHDAKISMARAMERLKQEKEATDEEE